MAAATAGIIAPLSQYYRARAGGIQLGPREVAMAEQGNQQMKPNYSPTAYIAQAARTDASRPMDYVGTVVFVDTDADLAKANLLAGR